MPSANTRIPVWSLQRLNPWYPAQFGVAGAGQNAGLRRHTEGKVLFVDPYYPGAETTRDGTEPDAPLSTVAAALTKCRDYAGDIILVMANDAWQYGEGSESAVVESVTVTTHGVSIIGISPSGAVGVVWQPAAANGVCVTVHAMDVLIDGFCFDAPLGGDGISAEWDGATLWGDNLVVRNCYFSDRIDKGIILEYTWNAYISDCIFNECDEHAIYVDPAGSGIADCRFERLWFQNPAVAMAVNNADRCVIKDCEFYNANAQGGGAAANEGIDTTGGSENLVINCSFSCLLPVPANGDWDNLNTGSATDAWIGNHCINGQAVATPA